MLAIFPTARIAALRNKPSCMEDGVSMQVRCYGKECIEAYIPRASRDKICLNPLGLSPDDAILKIPHT